MFRILIRTVSSTIPTLHSLRNHQTWSYARFASTTSSSRSKAKGNPFTLSYLIDTCGFSPERAASIGKYLNFETREKPDLAFEFFKSLGLSQSQVLTVIRGFPQLLLADPQKSLKPKIDFFKSKGFSDSDICSVVLRYPVILARSLQNEIIPGFDFFNNISMSKDKLFKTVVRFSGILIDIEHRLRPNMKLLREEGVPESRIVRFLEHFPRTLMATHKKFLETVRELKELEFDPVKSQFPVAIHVKLRVPKSSLARKEGIYKKWGWTDDDISATFRVYPWIIAISDHKIEAIMDFLVNKLGYTPSCLARFPTVLSMSLEKRIIPRGSVFQVLMSRGLVKRRMSLSTVFNRSEKLFLSKFVSCHGMEADELLKLYHAKRALANVAGDKF